MSYICKGDIPKSCSKCPQRTLYRGISVCLAANKMKVSTSNKCRHDNCPLVEIPTPHGRLIDADRFLDWLKEFHPNDVVIMSGVRNARTVIEAEV